MAEESFVEAFETFVRDAATRQGEALKRYGDALAEFGERKLDAVEVTERLMKVTCEEGTRYAQDVVRFGSFFAVAAVSFFQGLNKAREEASRPSPTPSPGPV